MSEPETFERRQQAIETKASLLVERHNELRKALKESRRRVAMLEADAESLRRSVEHLKRENERLKVVAVLTPTREDAARARTIVNKLLREIDKCIADLDVAPPLPPEGTNAVDTASMMP